MTSSNERTNDTGIQEGAGLSRRDFLVRGGSTLALLAMIDSPLFARIAGAADDGEVIPFLDRPPAAPDAAVKAYGELNRMDWQQLSEWITPNDQFFTVSHYNRPVIRAEEYRARAHRTDTAAEGLHPRRVEAASATGSRLHPRVCGQSRIRVVYRRYRHGQMGRHSARSAPAGGWSQAGGPRGRLLRRRRR